MWYPVIGGAAAVCGAVVIICLWYVRKAFNNIDDVLDSILNKKRPEGKPGDDRISKLRHKACRIIDMYVADAEEAREEKETVQSFISDMSHQMRTPLAGITMYSELVLSDVSQEEKNEFLQRINKLSGTLQWMVDCLIKMSRLETGLVGLSPQMGLISETVSAAVETVVSHAAKKDIHISVSGLNGIMLYHDQKWTAEAISNVLENAVKYTPAGGSVEIKAEFLSLYSKIMVQDNGIGINKEDYNRIFKRFYRGKNAEAYSGTGLGLYLSRLIMEKQGGYITVESKEKGAVFSLFLQNCKK